MILVLGAAGRPEVTRAQELWVELTQGDLSDDRFAPTPFTLMPGDNFLFGVIEGEDPLGNIDRDYFSITVPPGFQFSQLILDNYASSDFAAFMGIQPGPIFPDDPDTVEGNDLLGWTLFGPPEISQDLLVLMGRNGQGFTSPLPSGTYSFWVQQIGDFTEWNGNFIMTAVPEPATLLLLATGLAVCGSMRRCR